MRREEGEKDRQKESKGEKKNEGEGWRERRTVSLYIFFFFSHPMSQHQTLTLLSKAGGSIDSIFSPPCCCDPETALWLDLDTRRENDGGNIKRKRVADNNAASSLFLSCFYALLTGPPSLFPELPRHDTCHELHAYVVVTPNAKQLMAQLLLAFLVMGVYSSPGSYL